MVKARYRLGNLWRSKNLPANEKKIILCDDFLD